MKKGKLLLYVSFIFMHYFFVLKADAKDLETVKVFHKPLITQAPVIIAYEEGFFKEQGINLEFVGARDAAEALILLIQGSLDAGILIPIAGMYNASGEGKNVRIVSGASYYKKGVEYLGLVIKDNSGVKQNTTGLIKNLKGKKIGVPVLGSFSHYLINNLLKENGMSDKDVELTIMPFSSIVMALKTDVLSAGELAEPFIMQLKNESKINFIPYPYETQTTFLIFGPNLLTKNPDLGIRFMIAYLKGCQKYNEGKNKRNIEILKKHLGLDEEILKKMAWPVINPQTAFEANNVTILNDYQEWLFGKDYINKKIKVDSMFDKNFMERAAQILRQKPVEIKTNK